MVKSVITIEEIILTLNVKIVGKNSTRHLVYINTNKSYMFRGPSALILREITTDEIIEYKV